MNEQKDRIVSTEVDQDVAYLLGAIASDGYYYKKQNVVGLAVKDEPFIDEFCSRLEAVGIPAKYYEEQSSCGTFYRINRSSATLKDLAKWVSDGNISFIETEGQRKMFLRGYFDGDGSLSHHVDENENESYRVNYTTTEEVMKDVLVSLLEKLSFSPYVYRRDDDVYSTGERFDITIYNQPEVSRFVETVGSSIPRKVVEPANITREWGSEKEHTKEELLNHLDSLRKQLNKNPTRRVVDERDGPSSTVYRERFGSFNNAIERVGLRPNRNDGYDEKELIDHVLDVYEEVGDRPAISQIESRDWCAAANTYKRVLPGTGWEETMQLAIQRGKP